MTCDASPALRHQSRSIAVFRILLIGLALAIAGTSVRSSDLPSHVQFFAIAFVALLSIFPVSRHLLAQFNTILTTHRIKSALFIFFASLLYLAATAHFQHRDLFPKGHDELAYALQARMIAHGRLWMPALPLPRFFDSFFVFTTPVYAPIYFPGTGLVNAPAALLNLPSWITPLLIAAGSAAVIFLVFARLMDGLTGLLAVVLLVCSMPFRSLAMCLISHPLMLFLGLLMLLLLLRWRVTRSTRGLVFLGAVSGLALITRPADALCYLIPISIAILATPDRKRTFRQIPFAILAALPFLSLQIIQNLGATGHALQSPYVLWLDKYQPGTQPDFSQPLPTAPAEWSFEKRAYYNNFLLPLIRNHTAANLPSIWIKQRVPALARFVFFPCPLLGLLSVFVLLKIRTRGMVLMLGILALMILCYSLNPIFLIHYSLSYLPILIFPFLAVVYSIRERFPASRFSVFVPLTVIAFCIASLPEFNPDIRDDEPVPLTHYVHEELPQLVKKPAVVLFTTDPSSNNLDEYVYNIDTLNPDDAPIVHANDLGPRNHEIFAYYAQHQPGREFYIFDRRTQQLKDLGRARELSQEQ